MKNQFSDLLFFIPKIVELFKKNPRRSLSALFRNLRKNNALELIGDYPIMATILTVAKKLKIRFSDSQLRLFLKQSDEYKKENGINRRLWMREFIILSSDERRRQKNALFGARVVSRVG